MNELYRYLSELREDMYAKRKTTVEIDMEHLFSICRVVCYMMQIKSIVKGDEDIEQMLKEIKAGKDSRR